MATPLNHFAEVAEQPDGSRVASILAYPKYYRDGDPATGTLTETDCNFEASDFPLLADWQAKRGVASMYVKNDGTYAIKHLGHALKFQLVGLVVLKPDRTWERIGNVPTYGTPTLDADTITWENIFAGVSQTLHAVADQHRDVFTIQQQARDNLQAWLTGHGYSDLTGHYLAFAYEVEYKSFGDTAPFSMAQQVEGGAEFTNTNNVETTGRILHLIDGRVKQYLQAGAFRHETEVDADGQLLSIAKLKRFATVSGKRYFLEGCNLQDFLDMPSGTVISNTTVSYQEGTEGYSGCIDNYTRGNASATNYGGAAEFWVGNAYIRQALLAFDLPDLGSVTVTDAYYTLEQYQADKTLDIGFFQVFKPWEEMDSSFRQWDISGANDWTVWGCKSADDGGVENSGDGTGADRVATADISVSGETGVGTKVYGSGAAGFIQLVQDWLDGTFTDTRGVSIQQTADSDDYLIYRSSEYATAADRPKLTIVYDAAGGYVPYPFSRGLRGGNAALSGGLA